MSKEGLNLRTDLFRLEGKDQRVFMEEMQFELDFKGWKGFHKIRIRLGMLITG